MLSIARRVFRCFRVYVSTCFLVSVFPCLRVYLFTCFLVSVFPCVRVYLSTCFPVYSLTARRPNQVSISRLHVNRHA